MRGVEVAPRDVVAAALPDPATLGDRMRGKTCAGTLVTGTGKDGEPRATYLYHVADNEQTMREYGHQAVVLQTALNPVVALELLATATWSGTGVLGPEAFDAAPFLELLAAYGEPHGHGRAFPSRLTDESIRHICANSHDISRLTCQSRMEISWCRFSCSSSLFLWVETSPDSISRGLSRAGEGGER